MRKTFVIAEAGVNHNGSLPLAKKLVDAAKEAKADCVKFQTFIAENVVSSNAAKADYQKVQTGENGTQLEMIKKLELSFEEFKELKSYCDYEGIEFMSTAFDLDSLEFINSLNVSRIKIPSGEITNLPLLIKAAQLHKPVILSTGMSNLEEVGKAITVLIENGVTDLTVLHCTTEYPAPFCDVNLNAMLTIKNTFNVKVGYSDHTEGCEISVAAVALGAAVIEKHFTLDKTMEGPDHKASLEPDELEKMIASIRKVELALGDGIKHPADSEIKNIAIVRKSIVAKCDIKKGDLLSEDNLAIKRPGNGISPMRWFEIIGQKANKDYKEDELIVL